MDRMLFANRACTILYNYLLSHSAKSGYWLLPLNSCPIVPITFLTAGVPFKFVDIESSTLCMDRNLVLNVIDDRTCLGLLFIYSYGVDLPFDQFFKKIKNIREDITIIEDKCLCPPSFEEKDKSTYSDLCLYSTGYAKYVDIGFGGFALASTDVGYRKHPTHFDQSTSDGIVTEYKKCLKNTELLNKPGVSWIDDRPLMMNKKEYIDTVQVEKKKAVNQKKLLNSVYKANIPSSIWLEVEGAPVDAWRFNLLVPFSKEEFIERIEAEDLFVSSHYKPVDQIFNNEVIGSGHVAYSVFNRIINLFNDKYFCETHAEIVSDIIKQFFYQKA